MSLSNLANYEVANLSITSTCTCTNFDIVAHLWHFVCFIPADQSTSSSHDGNIRLVGGSGPHEGLVEIYLLGMWGRVCTSLFHQLRINATVETTSTSTVVCRQLGYSKALPVSANAYDSWHYTSNALTWLDVSCNGSETNLTQCSNFGLGEHYCSRSWYGSFGSQWNLAVRCSSELKLSLCGGSNVHMPYEIYSAGISNNYIAS